MCTALWIVYGDSVNSTPEVLHMLSEKVAEVSEVVFFILGKVLSVVICAINIHGLVILNMRLNICYYILYSIHICIHVYIFAMFTLYYTSYIYTHTRLIHRRDDHRGDSGRAPRVQGGDRQNQR